VSGAFKDHFSGHAADYASFRPDYPPALFAWLATLTPGHEIALDCATGNGQAAIGLTAHYRLVVASDASARQVSNHRVHERIFYLVAPAERSPLKNASCDLLTVAQAAHWFDHERFNADARRVVKSGGAVVVWTYDRVETAAHIDPIIDHFYRDVVGSYWPPERRWVEDQYRSLPFAFEEIATPPMWLEMRWTLEQYLGYVGTWSAVQRYRKAQGSDPLPALRSDLARAWGVAEEARLMRWPLCMRAGRV